MDNSRFVDPRSGPRPRENKSVAKFTSDPSALVELYRLCRESRIYDVERWIAAGRPLQIATGVRPKGQKTSALEIALKAGNRALVYLLLCNRYDPNLEQDSPLNLALRNRSWDLLDLLLEWGADPLHVSVGELLDTYQSELFNRFTALGVDLTVSDELAYALGYHTSNKPLFGWVKNHR